ncbi:hypothetical protein Tco_0044312 [Tanacetum coccineum]
MKAARRMDLDILSEGNTTIDHYQDAVCEHHDEQEMHDDVQPNYVVDSHADYMSNSNMILYDQYVKDNAVPVVQIVDNSLTAELETYKEQVELYERRARHHQDESKTSQRADHCLKTNQSVDIVSAKYTCNACPKGASNKESRERGFEQTKACYLTEVIPFFKTLKEHFEGIQKALTKEVKEMKEIFKELEAEVDQHVVDRKHNEIERKNLLIANDNLIADSLFKDVFHVATNSERNVSSLTEMHDAHTSWKRIFKKRNKKKAKNKQIQAQGEKSKSKVIRMKKIQLEGLKLPSLKLYYKRLKRQGPKLPTGQRLQLSYKTSGDQTAYSPKKSSFPPQIPVTTCILPNFSPAKPLLTLAKIISSTLLPTPPPSCIKSMLAIPLHSQSISMVEIVSNEAQMKLKAGIRLRIASHNKHTSFFALQRSTS